MGQPRVEIVEPPPEPILSVPAGSADDYPAGCLILRATRPEDVPPVRRVNPDRILWIEAPQAMAEADWPPGAGLDVIVADPAREAPALHGLSRLRGDRPVRVTIPAVAGVGRAARIVMALQLPVRLLPGQPSPEAVTELHAVLESYLHDPQANASVQPFDAALEFLLHGRPVTSWMALDLDPAFVRRLPGPGEDEAGEIVPGSVDAWIARLVENGAECASCPYTPWCAGIFKWPDPAYSCEAVQTLLGRIGESALAIARDLDEARNLPS